MLSYDRIATVVQENLPAALCIVTETTGSTPRKAGARMLVFANGNEAGHIEGTIGGGTVEHEVRMRAVKAIASSRPEHFKVALTHELGMCCGGRMTIFIEPLRQKTPCIVFGAGHIAQALSHAASLAGFDIHICDPRSELLTADRLPFATALLDSYDFERLPFGTDAFVVVATHSHQIDQTLVEQILPRSYRYLALVGSKRKAFMTKQRCINKGFTEDDLERLHCPAGINIHAETPEEIAVSILAQMIQVKRVET